VEGGPDKETLMVGDFQNYCNTVIPRLDEALRAELSLIVGDAATNHDASLEVLMEGGKMIRGCLLCMLTETFGGTLVSAIPRAVAVELIHGATLIHDDFVDQDSMRRNSPAIWTLEGARRAVLLGDIIFATTIKRMNDLSREDGMVVSHAIAQVSKGAFQEPLDAVDLAKGIRSGRADGKLYEKIIHLKTGILFGAACRLAAIAAQESRAHGEKCCRYGSRIGEAYQIADDMKEVRHHLKKGAIRAEEMAFLAPAFLHFMEEAKPHILSVLESEGVQLEEPLLSFFQRTVTAMEAEIERRLSRAISEVEGVFPRNEYQGLAKKAPWDLIRMFHES
jgi:geranylgeranyl pyrophosphate synthase